MKSKTLSPSIINITGSIILAVSMFALGIMSSNLWQGGFNTTNEVEIVGDKDGSVENLDFDLFWSVWDTIKDEYVDEGVIDEKEMFYGAIRGMVSSLDDPATLFLSPEETQRFNDDNAGKAFEGIGAELGYRDGRIVVISPLEGSPAKAAGILPGDVILQVDGEDIKASDTIFDVVYIIRGEADTDVVLTVMHSGDIDTMDITITRGQITLPSMEVKDVEGETDILVFDVARFTDISLSEWNKNWNNSVDEILSKDPKGLILDLRGNPGGFFDAAVYAGEEFLKDGTTIARQEDRNGNRDEYKVHRDGLLLDIPMVILVDNGSASASEILSGALQMNDRAIVIGEDTYGKGTAQTVLMLEGNASLHVTILKWLLPDGSWLNRDNPIKPDVEVPFTLDDFKEGEDTQLEKAVEELKKLY